MLAQTLKSETTIAVAQANDGALVIHTCVSPQETAVWLTEVAMAILDEHGEEGRWDDDRG